MPSICHGHTASSWPITGGSWRAPYEVVWDGTAHRPMGRLLVMPEETRQPRPDERPAVVATPTWRDLPRGAWFE